MQMLFTDNFSFYSFNLIQVIHLERESNNLRQNCVFRRLKEKKYSKLTFEQ